MTPLYLVLIGLAFMAAGFILSAVSSYHKKRGAALTAEKLSLAGATLIILAATAFLAAVAVAVAGGLG